MVYLFSLKFPFYPIVHFQKKLPIALLQNEIPTLTLMHLCSGTNGVQSAKKWCVVCRRFVVGRQLFDLLRKSRLFRPAAGDDHRPKSSHSQLTLAAAGECLFGNCRHQLALVPSCVVGQLAIPSLAVVFFGSCRKHSQEGRTQLRDRLWPIVLCWAE